MKKLIVSLFLNTLILCSSVDIYAEAYVTSDIDVEPGYSCGYAEGEYFLIPPYYPKILLKEDEHGILLIDSANEIILAYTVYSIDDENISNFLTEEAINNLINDTENTLGVMVKHEISSSFDISSVDMVEHISIRDSIPCALATCYSDDRSYIVKVAMFYDSSDRVINILSFRYKPNFDGTKYTSDFYKILNTDPISSTYQESIKPKAQPTVPVQQQAQQPQPQQQQPSSEGDDIYKYLHDTADFYNNYADALERIDNAQNMGDVLGGIVDAYDSMYDYLGEYY